MFERSQHIKSDFRSLLRLRCHCCYEMSQIIWSRAHLQIYRKATTLAFSLHIHISAEAKWECAFVLSNNWYSFDFFQAKNRHAPRKLIVNRIFANLPCFHNFAWTTIHQITCHATKTWTNLVEFFFCCKFAHYLEHASDENVKSTTILRWRSPYGARHEWL